MKLKNLSTAILLTSIPVTGLYAAALDRSGQSVAGFLQPNNYFEFGLSVIDPNVSGKELPAFGGRDISDMAGDYYFPSAVLKYQVNPKISAGLIYDQPFGADAEYTGNNAFTHPLQGGTQVKVRSENLTGLIGYQPNENWNFYGGAAYQTVRGDVDLRGAAYSVFGGYSGTTPAPAALLPGYSAKIKENGAWGWVAGLAYQIPDIALKASLTYRSEIQHETRVNETIVNPAAIGINALLPVYTEGDTEITTPQSVNLDFQTGIMANTVAFANLRWVNWKDFAIRPNKFGQLAQALGTLNPALGKPNGFDLVAYTDDQYNATVGIGRKFNDKWAANVSVGWDSGSGNPITTLGPTEGYYNVGLGVQYSPAENYFIAGGVRYFWLGDAKAQTGAQFDTPNFVADFKDNDAMAYGMKIGYRF